MYKAIFIDWDNTIGDWTSSEIAAQQDLYSKYHLQEFFPSFSEWYTTYDEHNTELWERYGKSEIPKDFLQLDRFLFPLVQALGGEERWGHSPQLVALAEAMGEEFLALTNHYFSLLPDVKPLVETLSSHFPLTIVSNGFGSVQYYKIRRSGLEECFRHVVLSEEVGVQKPNPAIFDYAIEVNNQTRLQQGLEPLTKADVLMVGDSYTSDIQGAINAGIDQVWITPQADDRPATYKIESLKELLLILGI
ncbi:MAG: YjjG family noncanonical pyrimidine nucleotidase [Paludibacteraceae bacterium]|nr:YjjG family noncanonical pyrimidine nucleotidase [Paludibacteraceae bacterium]